VDPAAVLRLRLLEPGDEAQARAAHEELAGDHFPFLLDTRPDEDWGAYLRRQARIAAGLDLPYGWVASTQLVGDVAGRIVGRVSLRHELNEFLTLFGGHVGYAVRPADRRRGYATMMLGQTLVRARALGLDRVLVTCDVDNVASAAVIERCGGVLENVQPGDARSGAKRRYWVPAPPAAAADA